MPYIKETSKKNIIDDLELHINTNMIDTVGDLNFALTKLLQTYMNNHGLSYQIINDVVGALECCKQEFYRRIVVPYENEKITSNGDVY